MLPEVSKNINNVSLINLNEVAQDIIKFSDDLKIWIFEGSMGAGKTTIIKAICSALGVEDNVTSPTYALVNEYQYEIKNKIFHFDFYRIKTEMEAFDIGFEEYLSSGKFCFIEWPSRVASFLPTEVYKINIEIQNESLRNITLVK